VLDARAYSVPLVQPFYWVMASSGTQLNWNFDGRVAFPEDSAMMVPVESIQPAAAAVSIPEAREALDRERCGEAETSHLLHCGDARRLDWIPDESIHLIVTSPPYWTLKKYNEGIGQLGAVADYEEFMDELDKVWRHCFRVLVPGGRIVCVVGDVCLARRRNKGRHLVMPLHADIAVRTRRIGLDYLTPILWHKIANASYEVENGSSFLGKPYEPNAIVKNDIEYVLMLRKSGGYRQPTDSQRERSKLTKDEYARWFRSFWTDVPGESTRDHPAPFPVELAYRLVRMFSFVEDTVLDPFAGTFTTTVAAMKCGRHSIGNELDSEYFRRGVARVKAAAANLDTFFGRPPKIQVTSGC
jgi:site-specific DNA-methyltransferase (adenine-specific)